MNICVRVPNTHNTWSSSVSHITPTIRNAYVAYKERSQYYRETPHISNEYIVYRPDNDPYLPTYTVRVVDTLMLNQPNIETIITQDSHDTMERIGKSIPIIDMNDIYVFLTDTPSNDPNWVQARSYQMWAYRDFVYDRLRSIKKSYMSQNTLSFVYENDVHMLANQMVTIDDTNIPPNIVFNMSRNVNNSVYFERNDQFRRRVRICDNEYARSGYLGFYSRMTMVPGIIVIAPLSTSILGGSEDTQLLSTVHLEPLEETNDEQRQCILCVRYRINARFSPCEHQVCCSGCYSKMSKNECPVCRAEITRLMNV